MEGKKESKSIVVFRLHVLGWYSYIRFCKRTSQRNKRFKHEKCRATVLIWKANTNTTLRVSLCDTNCSRTIQRSKCSKLKNTMAWHGIKRKNVTTFAICRLFDVFYTHYLQGTFMWFLVTPHPIKTMNRGWNEKWPSADATAFKTCLVHEFPRPFNSPLACHISLW